jgi:hypothetical protein
MHHDYSQDLAYDTSRIRSELGYREVVSVDEGLRRTVAWLRAHPPELDAAQYDYAAEDAALALAGTPLSWPHFPPRVLVSTSTSDDPATC